MAADINSGGLLTLMAKILRGGEDSPDEASHQGGAACRGGTGHHHPQCQLLLRTTQRHLDFWKGIHNINNQLYSCVLYKLSFSWMEGPPSKTLFLDWPIFQSTFCICWFLSRSGSEFFPSHSRSIQEFQMTHFWVGLIPRSSEYVTCETFLDDRGITCVLEPCCLLTKQVYESLPGYGSGGQSGQRQTVKKIQGPDLDLGWNYQFNSSGPGVTGGPGSSR